MPTTVSQQFTLLAEKAEARLKEQSARSPVRIQIGSATCEQAAGADEVFDEFRKHVAASGRTDILLHRTGCTGRCSREPIVGVFVPGQMPIKYERVDRNLVHDIFTSPRAGRQAGAEARARRADRADPQVRNPHLRQRALLLEGRAVVRNGHPRETGRRRRPRKRRAGDGRQLLRRLQRRRRADTARTCSSGPTRSSIASRASPIWTKWSASTSSAARSSIAWRCMARRSAGSSSSSTATWPSSIARAGWPCGTTACSIRRAWKSISITAASRPWSRCWKRAIRSGSSTRSPARNSAAAAAAVSPRARNGPWPRKARRKRRSATSSATPTKATPARSWTAACWSPIR